MVVVVEGVCWIVFVVFVFCVVTLLFVVIVEMHVELGQNELETLF